MAMIFKYALKRFRAAIVDDDDFKIFPRKILRAERMEAMLQGSWPIFRWNNNGKKHVEAKIPIME